MTTKPTGGRAFPAFVSEDSNGGPTRPQDLEYLDLGGMTLRQWYAGQALSAIIIGGGLTSIKHKGKRLSGESEFAAAAYAFADAMISEDEK